MSNIVIVILNYNGWEDTIECLESLESTIRNDQFSVSLVIVDNASQNESVEKICAFLNEQYGKEFLYTNNIKESILSKCVLFSTNKNMGFSGGNNVGIKIALERGADYVLLLNNDTVVERDFLPPLVKLLEDDLTLGMVGPKIVDYNHRDEYMLGGFYSRYKCTGYSYFNTEKKDRQDVSFLSGCCWLIRRCAFEKCGLMDEKYFLYVEDVDYSCSFVNNGYRLSCTKDSVIYHKEGRSTQIKPTMYYYNTRNRLYLCNKLNYDLFSKVIFWLNLLTSRLFYFIFRPELRPYLIAAVRDFRIKKFGSYK